MILQPFISAEYYKNAIKKSFISSAGALFTALILTAIIASLHFLTKQWPSIQDTFRQIISDVSLYYPEELTFEWKENRLHSNGDAITVPWPNSISSHITALPNHFLYFSNTEKSPQDLEISTTQYLLFINNISVSHRNADFPEEWISQPLSSVFVTDAPFFVDKRTVSQFSSELLSLIDQSQLSIVAFLAFFFMFVGNALWFLGIETILVILLFKLYALTLTVQQTIKLCMHVMIPTITLNTLATLLYPSITIPLQTITFWILIVFLSYYFRKKIELKEN
ncbi:MAG: hypothetical protein BroJett025_05800 [Patescibacteria group bacterium]|nr:MAG: hypothetical protein BroJett025_05800 [Patescibacteria group bacterium]